MLALVISALLAQQVDGRAATQLRLDELVQRCRAEKVVRLQAITDTKVSIQAGGWGRDLTRSEDKKITCVLLGTNGMRDLRFGFIARENGEP